MHSHCLLDLLRIVSAVLLMAPPAAAQSAADPLPTKEQILAAWQQAIEHAPPAHIRETREFYSAPRPQPLQRNSRHELEEYCISDDYIFDYVVREFQDGHEDIVESYRLIVNRHYHATLHRNRDSNAPHFRLTQYTPGSWEPEVRVQARRLPWLRCANRFMPRWFAQPRIEIVQVSRPDPQQPEIVRVHFRLNETGLSPREAAREIHKRGYFDFDQAHFFCPLRYEIEMPSDNNTMYTQTGIYEYEQTDGWPRLQRVTIESPQVSVAGRLMASREVAQYEIVYNPQVDERMFWLSYYGFPEPVDITPPPRRWPRYVGFIIAAVILALLAITFRYLARHRKIPVNHA